MTPPTLRPGVPNFGLGWKPNKEYGAHGPAHRLFSAAPYLIDAPDHRPYLPPHIEQGQAGACWAFATTADLATYYNLRQIRAPLASPRYFYWNGRNEEYANQAPDPDRELDDTGTEPRLGLRAVDGLGYCAWDDCPYSDDPTLIRKRPPDNAYELSYSQKGALVGSIDFVGMQRITTMDDLMRRGYPPQFGMQIDEAFMSWTPDKGPIANIDENKIVGGHMLQPIFIDYAHKWVWFNNWWPKGLWGTVEGFGYMTFDLFGSSIISDVATIQFLPSLLRRAHPIRDWNDANRG
jgi:hypothetical protein